eukprot:TRINITY_DN6926_c0_g2_i1.p1 TRINITY_DN6926_c0_g2~~TRINITY_DN6926_c0_g2_i1.p1  ORF type:complete len:2370 (+),score=711.86 TRINITY_DN6926_c0_g2_i1:42-7151(+)
MSDPTPSAPESDDVHIASKDQSSPPSQGMTSKDQGSSTGTPAKEATIPKLPSYHVIEVGLRNDTNPTSHLESACKCLELLKKDTLGTDDQQHFFVTSSLPKFIQALLQRIDLPDSVKPLVTDFFILTIDLIVSRMASDSTELLMTLLRLATSNVSFYASTKHGKDHVADKQKKEFLDKATPEEDHLEMRGKVYARFPKNDLGICIYYIQVVTQFGKRGGFEAIVDRIKSTNPVPLTILKLLLKSVVNMRAVLTPSFLDEYVPQLHSLVFSHLLSLTNIDLKREDETIFTEIGHQMHELLSSIWPEPKILESFDKFNLDVALNSFKSTNLEKQLRGIKHIKSMVRRTDLKDEKNLWTNLWKPQRDDKEKEEKAVDPKFVMQWIKESEVAENICKLSVHPEIIKQGMPILIFLAKANQLDAEQVDMLWSATLGKHESVKHSIYTSITELAPHLQSNLIESLFERTKQLAYNQYDKETLALVKAITTIALKQSNGNNKDWYGLEIFWKVSQDDKIVSPVVASQAATDLVELLGTNEAQSQRMTYLDLCMENLKKGQSVSQTYSLMMKLLAIFINKRRKVGAVIESLDQKHQLLTHFFTELKSFKTTSEKNQPISDLHAYLEQIQLRLRFLQVILANSSLLLSQDQTDILWDALEVKKLVPEEGEILFQWLSKVKAVATSAKEAYNAFPEGVIDNLFAEKMTRIDSSGITGSMFNVFDRYFLYVNEKAGKIKKTEKRNVSEYTITGTDLMGMKNMWQIALESRDGNVSDQAIARLNSLHQYPQDSRAKVGKWREEYIATSMKFLGDVLTGQRDPTSDRKIERCLILLKSYVEELEGRSKKKPTLDPSTPLASSPKPLTLFIRTDKGPQYVIQMMSNETVKALKYKAAEHYGEPPRVLRVCLSDRELKEEGKSLAESKIADKQEVYIKRKLPDAKKIQSILMDSGRVLLDRKAAEKEKDKEDDEYDDIPLESMVVEGIGMLFRALGIKVTVPVPVNPEKLQSIDVGTPKMSQRDRSNPNKINLSKEQFGQLYQLLSYGDSIGEKVWDLLNLLPINEELYKELQSLPEVDGKVQWDQLMDSKSIFKLIYSLQIIQDLISSDSPDHAHNAKSWIEKFESKKGTKYLFDVFLSVNDRSGHGYEKAFALLLKILDSLAVDNDSKRIPQFKPVVLQSLDSKAMLVKLLEISLESATHLTPAAAKPTSDNQDASDVVKYSLRLIVASCLKDNLADLPLLMQYPMLDEWVITLILKTPEKKIREAMRRMLTALSIEALESAKLHAQGILGCTISEFFLTRLISALSQVEQYPSYCEQYFDLMSVLLRDRDSYNPEKQSQNVQLFKTLQDMIVSHPISEKSSTGEHDRVLIGLMNVTRTLLRKDSNTLKEKCLEMPREIFENCLFKIPSAENHGPLAPPKCKTPQSRQSAFRLLSEMCRISSQSFQDLTDLLLFQIEDMDIGNDWTYNPSDRERSKLGYVGLQNLGATCYMNSLLQQLFLIPEFRVGAMQAQDRSQNRDESVLYQFQLLFAFLQESSKRYYDTSNFCATIKDMDGRPINTSQQMDCNEFGNTLFDQLENLLKGSPQEKLLQNIFAGTMSNQLICKECPHGSERDEPFYTISLEVSRQKDIHESLKLFVKGEMLMGDNKYFCEICGKGVDTLKRACLKTLPNILFLHLKRFEFDYDRMKHVKLNDCCEFPMFLNMYPYTKEGLAGIDLEQAPDSPTEIRAASSHDSQGGAQEAQEVQHGAMETEKMHPSSYYEYELMGVVVHMGTVDVGHYYSYIQERIPSSERGNSELEGRRWFEFNDTKILPFDPSRIPSECFGGMEDYIEVEKATGKQTTKQRYKNNSAYILVYERSQKFKNVQVEEKPEKTEIEISLDKKIEFPKKEKDEETQDSSDLHPIDDLISKTSSDRINPMDPSSHEPSHIPSPVQNFQVESENLQLEKSPMNLEMLNSIWEDNTEFLLEKYVFDVDYFTFIWGIVNLYSNPSKVEDFDPFMRTIQFSTRFLVNIYSHSREKPMFFVWVQHLQNLYKKSPEACKWLLEMLMDDLEMLKEMFLNCSLERVRNAFAELITTAVSTLAPTERSLYTTELKEETRKGEEETWIRMHHSSTVIAFVETLLSPFMLKVIRRHNKYCSQYFLILKRFAEIGSDERQYLIAKKMIARLVEFTLGYGEYGVKLSGAATPTSMLSVPRIAPSNLVYMVDLLCHLVCSCKTEIPSDTKPPPTTTPGPIFQLNSIDSDLLLGKHFFSKLIREAISIDSVAKMTTHLCWENKNVSKLFINLIKDGLSKGTDEHFKSFFAILGAILDIQDSIQVWRIDAALYLHLTVIQGNAFRKDAVDTFVKYIMELANRNEQAKIWLFKHKEKLNQVLGESGYRII